VRTARLLAASVRDFGLLATLDQLPLAPLARFTRRRLKRRKLRQLSAEGFDEEHGTDTAAVLVGREHGPAVTRSGHFVSRYETTSVAAIRVPLDSLTLELSDFVFVDLGCGKGKPLLVAAGYPFRKLIGIDISEACVETARRNIACYGPEPVDPSRFELAVQDVEDFVFPDCPMVIYLFNSFPAKLLKAIVANLERSIVAKPRPVVIIYVNPQAITTIWRSPLFERIETIADRMPGLGEGMPRCERAALFATRRAAAISTRGIRPGEVRACERS
jgi:SAM-dependent methyltransferase